MHVVLGDGTMPSKELYAHLQGMRDRANTDGEGFWFLIQSKAEPTDTDRALVKWLLDHEIYFETISDDKNPEALYQAKEGAGSQNHHVAKKMAPKIVELMEKVKVDEPDDSRLLGLFVSDDPESDEDRWLNDVVFAVADAGFKVYALNDGMAEIDLEDSDNEEAMEIDVAADVEVEAEKPKLEAVPDLPAPPKFPGGVAVGYTREELEEMDLTEVKKLAAKRGITLPPRTRFPTYIKALLGELTDTTPEAEVTDGELDELLEDEEVAMEGALEAQEVEDAVPPPLPPPTLTGSAMLIIVANGHVTSRVITLEQALMLEKAAL